jgi:uncharacterized membrane protein HdeD (DUF308 family)
MRTFVVSWWALALRGVLGILLGIAAFAYTGFTLAILVLFFAAYLVVDGVFGLIAGIRVRSWWIGTQGALGILAGIIAWRWPGIAALVLVALTVVWAILTGAIEIGLALALRRFISGEVMLIVSGILSILFGIVLGLYAIFFPVVAITVLTYLIGAYAFLAGIVYLMLAFRLRSFGGKAFVAST